MDGMLLAKARTYLGFWADRGGEGGGCEMRCEATGWGQKMRDGLTQEQI